jgi:hypothetical protein
VYWQKLFCVLLCCVVCVFAMSDCHQCQILQSALCPVLICPSNVSLAIVVCYALSVNYTISGNTHMSSHLFYAVLCFASQLSFLSLNTHPYTDPDNSCLTVMAYSVFRFSLQRDPLSLISDSRNLLIWSQVKRRTE